MPAHPRAHVRSHLPGPAQQALGGPLVLCPMACGHVGRVSGEPGPVLARVGGDPLLPEVEFDQRFTGRAGPTSRPRTGAAPSNNGADTGHGSRY